MRKKKSWTEMAEVFNRNLDEIADGFETGKWGVGFDQGSIVCSFITSILCRIGFPDIPAKAAAYTVGNHGVDEMPPMTMREIHAKLKEGIALVSDNLPEGYDNLHEYFMITLFLHRMLDALGLPATAGRAAHVVLTATMPPELALEIREHTLDSIGDEKDEDGESTPLFKPVFTIGGE